MSLAIGSWFYRSAVPKRVWLAGAMCSVIPDLDAIGFWAGVPSGSFWGHRGFTHSVAFAALLALAVAAALRSQYATRLPALQLILFLFLATASHGLLDAFTNGGRGIALLAPFDNSRYFFPFRPIAVAPISVTRFFTARGMSVFASELLWVWLPSAAVLAAAVAIRRRAFATAAG